MLEGLKARKPWIASLVTLFFGPILGMCYLNRGKRAIVYALVLFIPILASIIAGIMIGEDDPMYSIANASVTVVNWVICIVAAIQAYLLAKRWDPSEPLHWYANMSKWIIKVGIICIPFIAVLFVVRLSLFEPFSIPSHSMEPNFNSGDDFIVNKITYNSHAPARGDVIIFKVDDIYNIKRVIGLPGEKIQIKHGVVYINSNPVSQKQIGDYPIQDGDVSHKFVEVLPEGKKYDVIYHSADESLNNTSIYSVPPNAYFVLGDNRDQSVDSREVEKIGFVPDKNIVGKAVMIYWEGTTKKLALKPIE